MTRLFWLCASLFVAVGTMFAAEGKSGDPNFAHIYRLTTTREGTATIELSAFKVKGRDGLYTALHGVVGAKSIRAFQHNGKVTGVDMVLEQADVARDIAYLVPEKKDTKLPTGGLSLGVAPDLTTMAKKPLTVYGYPMGVDELGSATTLTISNPAVSKLSERCPPAEKAELNARNSPDIGVQVLRLDGNLLPGHSGAAVMDADGCVVAIGSGGLDQGRVGMGWGIPFHDVKLTAVKEEKLATQLTALAKKPVSYKLFCILNDDARLWFKPIRVVTTTVIAGKDGEPVLASKRTPTEAINAYMDILKDTLKDFGGKGGKDNFEKAQKLFADNTVPLASGTMVEVKEVEVPKAGGAPAMPGLPGLPGFPLPGKGKSDNPFGDLAKLLGGAAEGLNVKVKVLDGPHKDKELWVVREFIKRETIIKQDK